MLHKLSFPFGGLLIAVVLLSVSCSAQTEDQALASVRQLSQNGMQPPEDYLSTIERRFAGKRAGALARLLHGRIKFDNKDFAGAAAVLNSDDFSRTTKIADYALLLRGQALQQSGSHAEAMRVFEKLTKDYPDSVHATEAKLLWADSVIAAGQAAIVPAILSDLDEAGNLARVDHGNYAAFVTSLQPFVAAYQMDRIRDALLKLKKEERV